MPFYTFEAEDGERIEEFMNMSEMKKEINKNNKIYKRVLEAPTAVHFKGNGWTKNNSQDLPSPRKTVADVGYKVDYDKKREMEQSGEI